jgi:predicted ribosomally synthesized peptide with SipW-like signal peptide
MKKIIKSGLIVLAVAAIAGYGTYSFFSDEETSNNNTFTAGAIDLSLGGQFSSEGNVNGVQAVVALASDNAGRAMYNFTDLKPGDQGEGSFNLQVTSNEAYVCAKSTITATPEHEATEPEVAAGDSSSDTTGELQNYLQFATFADLNNDNTYDSGEPVNVGQYGGDGNGITAAEIAAAGWVPVADTTSPNTWLTIGTLPSGTPKNAGMLYCFGNFTTSGSGASTIVTGCDGSGAQNIAQTDGVVGSIEFSAVQVRNNPNFTCVSLNTPKVGAVLGAYNAPTCTLTVGVGQSTTTVQGGVDAAASGQTVCVVPGTYAETVLLNKDITLASTGGPAITAITSGINITASGATVSGFEVNPGSFLGTNVALYLNGSLSDILLSYNDIDGLDEALSRGIETTLGSAYTNVVFNNNSIHDLASGIYTNTHTGTDFQITYNDIFDNGAGIGGLTGADVMFNHFTHSGVSQEAIGADSSYTAGSDVTFNNFLNGTMVNTYGAITGDVNAINNFWGPSGGATQTGGTNEVIFTPEAGAAYPHN